jgi:DNA polymerase I-like protein with 3'-5' exonuclease and polymerase domains
MESDRKVLVDARNWAELAPRIMEEVAAKGFIGFDIETEDSERHEGLNRLMKINDEGKKGGNTKLVFDTNRTTVTGFSIYPDENHHGYYINLAHADIENRVSWADAKKLLEAKQPDAYWVIHNASFEWTMMAKALGFDLGTRVICTLQLCVTAYSPDTYFIDKFREPGLGGIERLLPAVSRAFAGYEPGQTMNADQEDLLYKVIAKESDAAHSYNGYVASIKIGYDLKRAVHSWFGYKMATFDETLRGRAHMGQLTGEETFEYGVDDAYWCLQLFHRVMQFIMATNPPVFNTYMEQEMPFVRSASDAWQHGIKLNGTAVLSRRDQERSNEARCLRTLKAAIRDLLPFPDEPHEKLLKYDKWYFDPVKGSEGWKKYRTQIAKWANQPDSDDDFEQCMQTRGPVSNAWAIERGVKESSGVNLVHYMPMRTVIYDLLRGSYMQADGKTQSDGDCRDELERRWIKRYNDEILKGCIDPKTGEVSADLKLSAKTLPALQELITRYEAGMTMFRCYKEMASISQRVKLYLTPYLCLVDPDTGRVYPQMSSMLATRRSSCQNPNGQQLSKFGEAVYVRGFFEADDDDAEGEEHVLVSADWSAVELVIIGDYSNDPKFRKAYGQRPHEDLHKEAVTGLMGLTDEEYESNPNKKQLRTDIGKPANFGYWYSGALGTTGEALGWTSDFMWEMVDKYRATFSVAEEWRVSTIEEAREKGYVELPDHHRRDRFEATYEWINIMKQKFASYGDPAIAAFGDAVIKKINRRAGNQCVNAKVQGLGGALAKRAIIRMKQRIAERAYRARFYLLVHDELIYSVPRSQVIDFCDDFYDVMIEDAGLMKNLKLDSSLAVGKSMQPWNKEKCANGQVELMEMQKGLPCISEDRYGKRATREERLAILNYILDGMPVETQQEEEATA